MIRLQKESNRRTRIRGRNARIGRRKEGTGVWIKRNKEGDGEKRGRVIKGRKKQGGEKTMGDEQEEGWREEGRVRRKEGDREADEWKGVTGHKKSIKRERERERERITTPRKLSNYTVRQ